MLVAVDLVCATSDLELYYAENRKVWSFKQESNYWNLILDKSFHSSDSLEDEFKNCSGWKGGRRIL
jgi:hypothetical protein